jgi:predicted negative regulator of RcsB-dependent stress response
VNNATKRELKKQDQFITLTGQGLDWANQNRRSAITTAALLLILILAIVGGYLGYQHRETAAATAFGAAMQTYQTPLVTAGQALPPGMKTFPDAAARAKAANAQFVDAASRYSLTSSGKLALYFAGLTYMEEGQNSSAEDTLKKVSSSWDRDLAALGKLALAQLYQQTGRDSQAADIYHQLAKGKANTVPPSLAQIQLAEMYSSEGKADQAKQIYAKLKDSDKDAQGNPGPAGALAAEKLNPKPAGPAGPQ